MALSPTEDTLIKMVKKLQERYGSALKSKLVEEANERGMGELDETLGRLVEKGLVNEIVPNAIYSLGVPHYCPSCVEVVQSQSETSKDD